MEVVHHHVEKEEVAEQLQTRRRRPGLADPSVDSTSSSSDEGGGVIIDGYKSEEVVDKFNGISGKSVYLDKSEGMNTLQLPLSGKNLIADVDIPKIMNAVFDNQKGGNSKDHEILSGGSTSNLKGEEENIGKRGGVKENVRIDLAGEGGDEVIELEFVRAVEKLHTHTPHCPKCNYQITKVILRRRKEGRPGREEPGFGCLKCFSIFLPSGIVEWIGGKDKPKPEPELPGSEVGPANTDGTTPTKPGNCFDLSWIFRTRGENGTKPDPEGPQVKPDHPPEFTPLHPALTGGDQTVLEIPHEEEHDVEGLDGATVGQLLSNVAGGAVPPAIPDSRSLEILKCIVYGGLVETITSLSVVSSAAASDASTLSIIAIGLATVFSGLIVFGNNLADLKRDVSGYQEQLGITEHYLLHATFAVFSYLLFGLIPPITYGLAFYESDNKDYKILAVAAAAFISIFVLAMAKAYVKKGKFSDYIKSILYYVTMAVSVSGVSYAAGDLITMLLERLGWFQPTQAANSFIPDMMSTTPAWASY